MAAIAAAFVGVLAMLLALGAASSVLDALQSLTASKSSSPQTTGFGQTVTSPFDVTSSAPQSSSTPVTGAPGWSPISPATMSALLAAQSQSSAATTTSAPASRSDALKDLFSQLDTNGDGQISQSEFENALGAGGTNLAQADDVFSKLDTNGDGSVSLDEMSKALQGAGGKGGHHHHHHVASSGGSSGTGDSSSAAGSSSDPLLQALDGASSTSVTNSDGSTTTSVTYADGSKVTMTSPAATTSSGSATSSYNIIEQMIQREAQAISSGAIPSLSLNV
jgi:Ca2+-binding EF-hand superfamily protein